MYYISFKISKYRAIEDLEIKLENKLIPLIGVNECGKTTILQAIYSFDSANDNEYGGSHINSVRNLYETVNHDSIVSAKISLKSKEIVRIFQSIAESEKNEEIEYKEDEEAFNLDDLDASLKTLLSPEKELVIEIERNISKKTYATEWNLLNCLNNNTVKNLFCDLILRELPYILYNDDFMDRPPAELPIPNIKPQQITGWLAIYERLFVSTDPNYSLFKVIHETDQRLRDSIISDVEEKLNTTLTAAWKSFSTDSNNFITVSLRINDTAEKSLQINIVEKLDGKSRYFKILDRSKGFIWHYNFIMKTQFNPKIVGKVEDTIFLLDEPGSYLHSSAQEKLCRKLAEISKSFGIVIYCTHSHHLLDPNTIPIKNIIIVEKNKSKKISTTALPLYKSKSEKTSALQPIYEALNVPFYEIFSDKSTLVLVEGINDKYAIELFCSLPKTHRILPGTSADSIIKNIQYLIAYDKNFIALWDNDAEGNKSKKRAQKSLDLKDSQIASLPLEGRNERKMENMFDIDDLKTIASIIGLAESTSYDTVIPAAYHASPANKRKIKSQISESAKKSFSILEKIIFGR
jgi:predicted ATP-dependent endonuclease of OLD family